MEDYAAKMLLKTDAALREYVTGHVQYREAAVLAALDELRRRGQPAPEEAALRPGLEVAAAQRAVEEKALADTLPAREDADAPAPETGTEPALYSLSSIVTFSLFPMTTMIAGGVLLCMNLFRLGRKRAMLGLVLFMVAYVLLGSQLMTLALLRGGLNPFMGMLLFNLPAALAYMLWWWPRYVGSVSHRSRSVLPPMLVCLVILWGMQRVTPYLIKQQPKEAQQEFERLMKR
jgi:hypothetical protein